MKTNKKLILKFIWVSLGLISLGYLLFLASFGFNLAKGQLDKARQKAEFICKISVGKGRELSCFLTDGLGIMSDFKNKQTVVGINVLDRKMLSKIENMVDRVEVAESYLKMLPVKTYFRIKGKSVELEKYRQFLANLNENKDKIKNLIGIAPELLGQERPISYTWLFQNNMELRATGGFMGSFAQMQIDKSELNYFYVQDIYVPDGQLKAHVNPPDPIGEAFKHGFWKLRDSNWNPDFSYAAEKQIAWFLEGGKEKPGEVIVAVNLAVAEKLLEIIGPIYLPDYNQEVNASNFYAIAQHEAEVGFFPGSTQKKDFLSLLANKMLIRLENLSYEQYFEMTKILIESFEKKDIQLFSFRPTIMQMAEENGWAGKMGWNREIASDYQMLVESNLGANKANCCVVKKVYQKVTDKDDNFVVNMMIDFKNNSPVDRPRPPKHWGGDYRNFFRIYLPQSALINQIRVGGVNLKESEVTKDYMVESKIKEYGFWANVRHQEELLVEITYHLPKAKDMSDYGVLVQKQSGATDFWQEFEIEIGDKQLKTKKLIDRDMVIKF